MAVVAALNGAISGARQIYDWRSGRGIAAFALDSTWAIGTTTAALGAHVLGAVRGRPGFVAELSRRQNRHVYARGLQVRRGFAVSIGNVVNGAGDVRRERRARLVTDHEDVHVWQARLLGPVFPITYLAWMAGGAVVGAAAWLVRRPHDPEERFTRLVESCAYYLNPYEWWAYSRAGQWPPRGLVAGLGWRRPAVRSFRA